MKDTLQSFYTERIERFTKQRDAIKNQLRLSSTIRLVLFIAGAAGIYFLWSQWQVAVVIAAATFAGFLFLVSRHENLRRKRDFQQALLDRNELELQMLHRDFHHRATGSEFLKDDHEFSRDIDLFGAGSFFQYVNRSVTKDGITTLASQFLSNDFSAITQKQEAIQELSQKVDFRHDYGATATLLNNEKNPKTMLEWIKSYKTFVPQLFYWLPYTWFGLSIFLCVAYFNDWVNGFVFAAAFFGGLGITGKYVKRITELSANISKLELFFKQYSQLILAIEKETFNSELLSSFKDKIIVGDVAASKRFEELAQVIGRLDQRNNMLFGILANGFGLWDLKQVHTIEKWLKENSSHIENWLQVVAQIDAMNSLGNFAYNHANYVYPTIETGDFKMQVVDAKHPLLDPAKAIGNDIHIASGEFFIITGANMAGKSTFLRTVSMNIVMANAGLPVWAQSMVYSPIKLITSMRTSDSLTDDESYFFSELKRLKYIVDKIETERYFIVLDEILKGTNSQDKANGSRKLIEKLSRKHATGIIATHDLSLTEVANEYDSISNYFFDADITNDELTFDYTFKDGIATNMNASFLLRKMGIVDE